MISRSSIQQGHGLISVTGFLSIENFSCLSHLGKIFEISRLELP